MPLVDVIEVEIDAPHHVRLMAESKSEGTAEAVIRMAVIRRGVEKHFFTTCPAGKYKDGDCLRTASPKEE